MPCLTKEANGTTAIICSRRKRCAYCDRDSTKLCDYPNESGKTCDTPMCQLHTWSPEFEKDYCRFHRRKIEAPEREAKRKAELASKKRSSLIFIAQSKYSGFCREKDCGSRWQQGEPMYWDNITREVFCAACGEMLSDVA